MRRLTFPRSLIPTTGLALAGAVIVMLAGGLFVGQAHAQTQGQAQKSAPATSAPQDAPPPIKQIALTDKQINALIAAQKEMDALTAKLPEGAADKPDPKLQAQFDAIVKKDGFIDYAEYGDVYDNVSLVMSGIDPAKKTFAQPPEVLKKQIALVEADKNMPAKDKKAALEDMNAALKTIAPVQFPENVTLVMKYYDQLGAILQDDDE
jgi:hypothetical protein